MATNKVSTLWANFTNDIASITKPAVAWETIAKEVIQLTSETTVEEETTPATYRVWVYPVDLNDDGAAERDIAIGYGFMSYLGDVFSIIEIGEDGSIDISDDSLCGYCPPCGGRAMIYSSSSPVKPPIPKPVISTRWIEVNLACTLDGSGNNTGIQTGISKKQMFNKITNVWEDTGEQSPISRTNYTSCPLPVPPAPAPFRASFSVGTSFGDRSAESPIDVQFGVDQYIQTPLKAGSNRLFLSIPVGKQLIVRNAMGVPVTEKYNPENPAVYDNVTGYQPNIYYRGSNVFITTDKTYSFTIKIY